MPRYKFEYEVEAECEEEAWKIAWENFSCFTVSEVETEEEESRACVVCDGSLDAKNPRALATLGVCAHCMDGFIEQGLTAAEVEEVALSRNTNTTVPEW